MDGVVTCVPKKVKAGSKSRNVLITKHLSLLRSWTQINMQTRIQREAVTHTFKKDNYFPHAFVHLAEPFVFRTLSWNFPILYGIPLLCESLVRLEHWTLCAQYSENYPLFLHFHSKKNILFRFWVLSLTAAIHMWAICVCVLIYLRRLMMMKGIVAWTKNCGTL